MRLRDFLVLALLAPGAGGIAAQSPTPAAAPAATTAPSEATATVLSSADMQNAIRSDAVSVPSPGEFLAAIDKAGKTGWSTLYRKPIATAFASRPQNALNVGGLIADGYLAVEAEDAQQVKNVGQDIIAIAKALGVSKSVMSRGKSITDFAEKNEWNTLKEELEATQNEVKLALAELNDSELIALVTVGAWVRGLEAVSTWVDANYTPEAGKLLRQPAVVALLRSKLESLNPQTQDDPLVKIVEKRLKEIETLVAFPVGEAPSPSTVKELKEKASSLSAEISLKK